MFEASEGKLPLKELILFGWMPHPLKAWFYRRRGYDIAATASLGLGSVVVGERVKIGPEARIGMLAIIKGREIEIGPRARVGMMSVLNTYSIRVGEGTRIGNQVVIGGLQTPHSSFEIGRNCILMEWSFINTSMPVKIGDDVGIGGHCLFFTHGLWPNTFEGFPAKFGPITIGDQAWLAWRVSVLPDVAIGARSIVSSDACVVKNVPAGSLAAGVPAKVLQEGEKFVGPAGDADNTARLKTALVDYAEWVRFQRGSVTALTDTSIALRGSVAAALEARVDVVLDPLRVDALPTMPGITQHLLVSRCEIPDDVRQRLDARGTPWLDIARKERSVPTNNIADDFEDFIRRYGIRFLKYGRWARPST